MASNVSFKFTGDSSELRAELKKVEKNLDGLAGAVQGTTNKTRKGLDGLTKTVEGTGKTAKTAANNNKAFSSSLDNVKDSAGETASIMGGLATSLSVVSPQAGAAVRAIGDLATGVEAASRGGSSLFAILGPVGVAVAGLGAAYVSMRAELDAANEGLKVQRERLQAVADMSRKVKEAVLIAAHAELQASKARGEATQAQVDAAAAALDEMAIAQRSVDLFGARREALTAERDEIRLKVQELQKAEQAEAKAADTSRALTAAHAAGAQGFGAFAMAQKVTAAETKGNSKQLQDLQHQLGLADTRLQTLNVSQERYEQALKSAKEAQQAATKSTENNTGKQKEQAEAVKATAAALAMLQSKNEAALVSQLNERQKILHSYQREIEAIQEVANQHVGNAEIENAADEAQHNRKVQAMRELDALDAENAEKRKQRQEEIKQKELETLQASMSTTAGILGSVSDLYGMSADKRAETDKKGAKKAFKVQQGLAKAAVTVDYFQSLMAAMKSGNPAQIVAQSTAASLMFAVSLAKISAQKPSFHSGTGLVRAPSGVSEMNARLRGGEAVSTPLGAELIGRSNIERANAGMRPGGGSGGVSFQYEHKVFSQFIRDNIRSRGPLSNEHDRRRHVGHRSA
jgi:hypothetical protein